MSATDADAELIRLSDRFAEIELREKALFVEVKDEAERDHALEGKMTYAIAAELEAGAERKVA
jgi:hypothetical protein